MRLVPDRTDGLVALSLIALGQIEAAVQPVPIGRGWDVLMVLAMTAPLAWRRRAPLTVLATVLAAVLVNAATEADVQHQVLILATALASYTAGRELPYRRAWRAPALIAIGAGVATLAFHGPAGDLLFAVILYVGPWAAGRVLRARASHVDALLAHADDLARDRDRAEAEAVEAERARIARELHDVIAHSISVIAIQSQAVRHRLAPEQTREAQDLSAIETTARQAMGELRRLLGVLRNFGEPVPLAPSPGLGQLPRLVDDVRAAGLAVRLETDGNPRPLPPGVDLAAYRVVQEALTNALKHAAAEHATVRIGYGDGALDLRIDDDGGGAAPGPGAGHGLIGMRERVAVYGGTFDAAPCRDGFTVHATLPLAGLA